MLSFKGMNNFTKQAQKLWANIPSDVRLAILNSVKCGKCRGTVTMLNITGRVEKGDLILNGQCDRCGENVGRLIES